MNETNSIDYNAKVLNFMAMTETGDPEVATRYLKSSNWDETAAVNQFFSNIRVNSNANNNNNINNNDNLNNSDNNSINKDLINNNNSNNNDTDQNEGFIYRYILSPLKALLNSCIEKREVEKEEEERIFRLLPNKVHTSAKFCKLLQKKIGIIMFYTANDVEFLISFINEVSKNEAIMNLLKQKFFIFPLLANTNEGYSIQNVVRDDQLAYPSFVFCHNGSSERMGDYIDYKFDRTHVIYILEGDTINVNSFNSVLLDITEKIITQNVETFDDVAPGEILQQQKSDMEALEKEIERKEEQAQKEKILEQQRIKEEEIKTKEIENKANEAKKKIPEEPGDGDPDATTICFRFPDGEKRKDRRFLKSNTIQNLYDYVTSLGKEIYSEEENNSFSLYQPFPPKKYDNMENTLEKEGLFPNAVVQIREE